VVDDLDDRARELDPRVVPLWRLSTAMSILIPGAIATTVLGGFLGRTAALSALVALLTLTVVSTIWYPPAKYRRWRWRLTDLALELHHGVWVRRTETLPYFRIQQIDVNQGPIDRLLDLASLEVTSASASGSVSLPGIPVGDAPAVRRALLERASAAATGDDGDGLRDAV
jgi:membrane protein YdbS with pleckstrin-like domain